MSTTLSNGFKLPDTGDKGSTFFPDLEFNIQRVNDHNHDGSNSNLISSTSISVITQAISSGSWAAVSGQPGTYKQTVSLPGSITDIDGINISFRDAATGHPLLLSVEKVSTTSYDVFINDTTLNLTAVYST